MMIETTTITTPALIKIISITLHDFIEDDLIWQTTTEAPNIQNALNIKYHRNKSISWKEINKERK